MPMICSSVKRLRFILWSSQWARAYFKMDYFNGARSLIELHQISVAKETLRQWMTEAGIWVSRRERKKPVFQPHGRRDCFGELIQIDGSVPLTRPI
jgi:hypothetical protein